MENTETLFRTLVKKNFSRALPLKKGILKWN